MANQGTHEKILRDMDRPGDARSRWGAHGGREGGWRGRAGGREKAEKILLLHVSDLILLYTNLELDELAFTIQNIAHDGARTRG
jgi:hypothetical protein